MVSLTCCLLCFLFTPVAQFIFCIYEPGVRPPTALMVLGAIILAFGQPHKSPPAVDKPESAVTYQYNESLRPAALGRG